jgi:hypothetical protein
MKIKITVLLSVFFLLNHNSFSQVPGWGWSTNPIGNSYDEASSVTTDATGNVYVTGYFYSATIDFGTFTLTNADPTANKRDMFIVKYDSAGVVLWAKSAGGVDEDGGYSITTDASGNVYVTGYFYSTTITFGSFTLTNAGDYDMFVVKYDAAGNVIWAKSAGKISDDYGRAVATDALNNVYVLGSYKSPTIRFGPTTLTNTDTSMISYDTYIVKYDSAGTVLWAINEGGTGAEFARSIDVDSSNNIFITGNYNSDTLIFNADTLVNMGLYDIFLAKYNSAGIVQWAKSYGGNNNDLVNSVTTDTAGNVFLAGGFQSPTIAFGSTILTNGGTYNIYLAKCDASGTSLWAKGATGSGIDDAYGTTTDNSGNVFIIGYFTSPTLTFGTTTLTNAGGNDIFTVKYGSTGTIAWAKNTGDINDEHGLSIATYASNIYITGYFDSPSLDFGATTLYNNGAEDMFLAKINSPSMIGISEHVFSNDISISPNPFNSQTIISFSEIKSNVSIKISDMLGKEIKNINFSGKEISIEKGEMKEGIYFINITDENKNVFNKKIVIQ